MAFTQVTLSTTYLIDGAPCSGQVTFRLSSAMQQAGVGIVSPTDKIATLNSSGQISIVLDSNQDATTQPTGTTYAVHEQIIDASGNACPERWYSVTLPATATADLATLAPTTPDGQYNYILSTGGTVTGNLEVTGEVTLQNALLTNGDLTLTPGKPQLAHYTPIASTPGQYPNSPFNIVMPSGKQIHLVSPQGFDHQIFFSGGTTISGVQYASITVYNSILNTVTDYPITTGGTYFEGITIGGDGQVYVMEISSQGLMAFNPSTHVYTTYGLPSGYSGGDRLVSDCNGNIVLNIAPTAGSTYNSNYLVFDTQTHAFLPPIQYTIELGFGFKLPGANGTLCLGDDGLLWYIADIFSTSVIVSIAPTTCEVVSYKSANMGSGSPGIFNFACDGGDRNIYMGYNNDGSGQTYITWQNKDTGVLNQVALPGTTNTYPLGIILHSDGYIYCADVNNARVFRLDRFTTNIEIITTLNTGYNSLGLTGDGNLYFGGTNTGTPAQGLRFDEILLNNNTWSGQNSFDNGITMNGAGLYLDNNNSTFTPSGNAGDLGWWSLPSYGEAILMYCNGGSSWTQIFKFQSEVLQSQFFFGTNPHSITQPAIPASGTAYTNSTQYDLIIDIYGGTVSSIVLTDAFGNTINKSTSGCMLILRPGEKVTIDYAVAPVWLFRHL